MRIATDSQESDEGLVNLTPLIDVVFLLLIFFMVTATFQHDERDLSITVPETEHGDPIKDLPTRIVVGVRKDGSYTIGSRKVDREELRAILVRARRKNGSKQEVMIRADRDAATRHPVGVLDLCAGLGIKTSLATTERTGD